MDFNKLNQLFQKRTQTRVRCQMTITEDVIYCSEGLIASLEFCLYSKD